MIRRLLWAQRGLDLVPDCPKHERRMIMLGEQGFVLMRPKQRMNMSNIGCVGQGGKLAVRQGLFRCPTPTCYYVAPIEVPASC